jgi:PAS domain S-box-containing protein
MRVKLLKIPLEFLIIGVIWALFSAQLISILAKGLNPEMRDIVRSTNHFAFVAVVAVLLYFEIKRQQNKLMVSEEQYRELFESNPNPMWIFNTGDLRFVKVNTAAVDLYGYSEDEFLKMTIKDIRPKSEQGKLVDFMKSLGDGIRRAENRRHSNKNGDILFVSIVSFGVRFDNKPCYLTMATNNTEVVLKEQKIVTQSNALKEIAWSNSHEVRRPLCSIMSLIDLLKYANDEASRQECIQLLEKSSKELDEVLRHTNKKVETL